MTIIWTLDEDLVDFWYVLIVVSPRQSYVSKSGYDSKLAPISFPHNKLKRCERLKE